MNEDWLWSEYVQHGPFCGRFNGNNRDALLRSLLNQSWSETILYPFSNVNCT